jgi:hypothetical protein
MLALEQPKEGLDIFVDWLGSRKRRLESTWHLLDDVRDLVSLKTKPDADRLSKFIQRCLDRYLRKPKDDMFESWRGFYSPSKERVVSIVGLLTVLFSAFLPVGSILVLHSIPAEQAGLRLSIVGIFTTVFAASVGFLTTAKREEVFAATAA